MISVLRTVRVQRIRGWASTERVLAGPQGARTTDHDATERSIRAALPGYTG